MSYLLCDCYNHAGGIHPATIANSYRSLEGKVLNLGHLMRAYNPQKNLRDRIMGTVMAVELSGPAGPLETPYSIPNSNDVK